MLLLYGIILTMRAKAGMIQENYDIIDEVNCKSLGKTMCTIQENNMLEIPV